jgi:hypothetical protein
MKIVVVVAFLTLLSTTTVQAHGGGRHVHGQPRYAQPVFEIHRECHGFGVRRHCYEVRVPVAQARQLCRAHPRRASSFNGRGVFVGPRVRQQCHPRAGGRRFGRPSHRSGARLQRFRSAPSDPAQGARSRVNPPPSAAGRVRM